MQEELGKTEAVLMAARRERLAALRERGNDPFAQTHYDVDATADELHARYDFLVPGQDASAEGWNLAGRLLSKRTMGKSIFADLSDRTGSIQLYVRKDEIGEGSFADWNDVERGDIVGVRGYVFRSKMGEITLHVTSFSILSKSLLPLPDKWHGLVNIEKRYRQRYVDLIVNPDARDLLIARSQIIAEMRRFIDARGFYEVETPTLLHLAGGAAARPFETHCNALDRTMQLRIATELNLKRLIVGGLERVYEIGRIFRNEGIDTTHNPEFTMLELYAAYWNVNDMLQFNEELIAHLVNVVTVGDTELRRGDEAISFVRPFARIGYLEGLERYSDGKFRRDRLLDPQGAAEILRDLEMPASPTHGHALDKIFERVLEPHLVQPTFVTDYPVVISPLAKRRHDDPELTERYELFCAQMEVSNAFSELNDPDDQRGRFESQILDRAGGDDEAPEPDWDYVRALEYGMPPTAGIGIGVNRLVMLLTSQTSIREILAFPLQRQHG